MKPARDEHPDNPRPDAKGPDARGMGEADAAPVRALYRHMVGELRALSRTRHAHFEVRENFHHAFWLATVLGLSQKDFAESHGFRTSTVNRWVTGAKAPPPKRRPALVRDAIRMLDEEIAKGAPVPMRVFPEDEAAEPGRYKAGRPAG
jgi:DNA-binding transcriptional regulator YdaS (Cro superfamily)